jgi:hypothetical protein
MIYFLMSSTDDFELTVTLSTIKTIFNFKIYKVDLIAHFKKLLITIDEQTKFLKKIKYIQKITL